MYRRYTVLLFCVNIKIELCGRNINDYMSRRRYMIKFPLYVTLDTNIFDSNKLDFSKDSTLSLLINYVETGKIKIVLSNIVVKEVEKHIVRASEDICSAFRGLRKEVLKIVSKGLLEQMGVKTDLLLLDKEKYQEKSLDVWRKFLENLNPEILDLSLIDLNDLVDDYFDIKPPFESGEKKRKEFPDAFIANQIRKRFGKDEVIAIVCNDNGLKKACGNSQNHIFYKTLGELYNAINIQETEYKNILQEINCLIVNYIPEIQNMLKNEDCVEVHGLSYDKDGIESGFDYSDIEVVSVKNISCCVRTIDEITDEIAWATLLGTVDMEVACSYEDYGNAIWDSENKAYFYLETRTNLEKHIARFALRIELNRKENSIRIIPFKIILNGDTLCDWFEITEDNDDEMDIINQEREDVGLCSLDCYDDYLDENLIESSFMNDIVREFEKINKLYEEYEEIAIVYDELLSVIKDAESSEVIKKLSFALKDVEGFPTPYNVNDIDSEEKDAIVLWVDQSYERLCKLSEQKSLPDNFIYGDTIEIHNGLETYQLNIGEFSGMATAGDQEDIDLSIEDQEGNIIAKGRVSLTVGYIEFDEEGNAGNGLADSIEYYHSDIVNGLETIAESIKKDITNEWSIAKKFEVMIAEE